jgi:hypothetical protein
MTSNHKDIPWLEKCFFENREKFPPEELAKYEGQYVAWSWDGTRIVASGADEEEVFKKLDAAGIDSSRVVFSYVDSMDTGIL